MSRTTLPIVDISRFRHPHRRERERFLAELRLAAHETGFFYVVGHGIAEETTESLFEMARRFFALPLAQRREIENLNSPQFRGYTAGLDGCQQLDFGPERPELELDSDAPRYLRLIGPNQWPSALPELRGAVLLWQCEAQRVAREVLRALAAALGQEQTYFDQWFDAEAAVHLKVVHHPPREHDGVNQPADSHKDYGFLALLQQDEIGGLQVLGSGSTWIDAVPLPGSFVVNIGEMLEIATNGYLKAARHRVLGPPPGVDRYSVPFFLSPRLDAVLEPVPLPAELAVAARGVTQDYLPLSAYGEHALMGWLRSHPRVAERWYSPVSPRPAN